MYHQQAPKRWSKWVNLGKWRKGWEKTALQETTREAENKTIENYPNPSSRYRQRTRNRIPDQLQLSSPKSGHPASSGCIPSQWTPGLPEIKEQEMIIHLIPIINIHIKQSQNHFLVPLTFPELFWNSTKSSLRTFFKSLALNKRHNLNSNSI